MEMAISASMRRALLAASVNRRVPHPPRPLSTISYRGSLRLSRELNPLPFHYIGAQRAFTSLAAVAGNTDLQEETKGSLQYSLSAAVHEDLQRIFTAMGLYESSNGEQISVSGKTMTWGIPSEWYMKWCLDGRFYERFSNAEITQEWGHDGKNTWYADISGRVLCLGMDEAEACLLTAWIRMGYWVTEEAQKFLEIKHKPEASTSTEVAFTVQLKKKELPNLQMILVSANLDGITFVQGRLGRGWDFFNWQKPLTNRSLKLPLLAIRRSTSTRENFEIVKSSVERDEDDSIYALVGSRMRPRHNIRYPKLELYRSCPPSVQMNKSRTGHYVIRPLINGREAGNFIVDTGTGTLAITQRMARQLGLSTFGEVHATSISGGHTLSTRFSRGSSFQLGPLSIKDPVFVQIGIDKLLKDAEGLCGFDIFYDSIVEMSSRDCMMSLYDPASFEASPRGKGLQWQKMYLYDRVPHLLAKVNGREVLLMLDTGAAGPGLMFPSSAVQGFDDQQTADMPATLGRGRTLYFSQADYGNVQTFEIGGCVFKDLTAMVPNKTGQQMGLSGYSAGVVCAEMLRHFNVVLDYANGRMAFVDQRFRRRPSRY
ncbi:hypothetical protein GOP47_0023828 [Adiantum capillus-veneris]|uniref:Uncharacterized protein n=1 Tax=Adiantum capillus-veneris TaxID=13818 RepID=A0A9D4U5E6_ADICA|nr:hypothetical protein GOP47_0023828 [Adiantum capillus-veneris]